MLSEDIEHFRLHAETNEVVHVYERTDTGAPVGFQFWRTAAMDLRDCRVLIGGKLRIEPEFRRRALHLRSGVRSYLENQLRHPGTRFYFLAVASLFGFVSMTSALADYRLFDPSANDAEGRAIRRAFEALAAQNHHRLDEATGLFAVGIKITEQTLAQYSSAYFDRPEARARTSASIRGGATMATISGSGFASRRRTWPSSRRRSYASDDSGLSWDGLVEAKARYDSGHVLASGRDMFA
jgi:hypothetical protein